MYEFHMYTNLYIVWMQQRRDLCPFYGLFLLLIFNMLKNAKLLKTAEINTTLYMMLYLDYKDIYTTLKMIHQSSSAFETYMTPPLKIKAS